MTEKGGTPHTINLCRNWYDGRRIQEAEEKVNGVEWKALTQRSPPEASSGQRSGWKSSCDMWEQFTIKKMWVRTLLDDAAKVTLLEPDGSWQNESPCKEELELLRHGNGLRFVGSRV